MTVKRSQSTLRTTSSTPTQTPAQTRQAAPPTPRAGWGPKTAAPATGADGFGAPKRPSMESLGKAIMAATTPVAAGPAQQAMIQSVDQLTAQVQTILHHDAKSLAQGLAPARAGEPLSAEQQSQLDAAAVDFLKSLPVGALAPAVAARLQAQLKDANVEVGDLATTRLGDLGAVGKALANQVLQAGPRDSPAAYYGLAGGLAAAVGYVGWTKGSEGLAALGIKPELKKGFFDDRLSVTLSGEFGARLQDLQVSGTVAGQTTFSNGGQLSGSLTTNSRAGLQAAEARYSLEKPNWNFAAAWVRTADGQQTGTLTTGVKNELLSASVTATRNAAGLQTVALQGTASPDANLRLSGAATRDVASGQTAAEFDAFLSGKGGQTLTAHLQGNSEVGLQSTTLGLTIDQADFRLSATSTFTPDGLSSAELQGHLTRGALALDASTTANADGLATVAASATYSPAEDFKLSAGLSHNLQTGETSGSADLSMRVNGEIDLALSASADSQGQRTLNLGARGKF